MKTKTIKKKATPKHNVVQKKSNTNKQIYPLLEGGERKDIDPGLIDFSPYNRRKYLNQKTLEELADSLKTQGQIHDLVVRPVTGGRFRLIAGERRLRAARIAKLKTVCCRVVTLTDDEEKEIILSENIHREDQHPLDEAACISDMMQDGKSIEDIAARLGKSKSFIYLRQKLLNLIEPVQEMFYEDKITTRQATAIAGISQQSQQEFFDDYCKDWKELENFELEDFVDIINRFTYDLKNAPFDTNDKKLIPAAGACTHCPFNTATIKSLFPEYAKEAVCTNRNCYHQKCDTHYGSVLLKAFEEINPSAFLFGGSPTEELIKLIDAIPGAGELPKYSRYDVYVIDPPEMPDKEDYYFEDDESQENSPVFDEEGFKNAMEEYNADMEDYNTGLQSGKAHKGMLITQGRFTAVMYTTETETQQNTGNRKVTAKAVQTAIKEGTATAELLKQAIANIHAREERAKELDREKVQFKLHEQFETQYSDTGNCRLTDADLIGVRMVIYKSLGYSTRQKVDNALFGERGTEDDLIETLAGLSDQQFACLIRLAIAGFPESKTPNHSIARCLYRMAENAGMDVQVIENEQTQKAKEREKRKNERVKELQKRMKRLEKSAV